jgi:hypothetical protein
MALQGGTVLVFGVDEETFGLVQSSTTTHQVERAVGHGANGDIKSIQEYNDTYSLSMNYLERATPTGEASIGTTFTYDGLEWYVDSVAETATVDGFLSVDVEATHYPNLGT